MAKRVALKDYVDLLGGYIGVWTGEYDPTDSTEITLTRYKVYGEITSSHSSSSGFSILTFRDRNNNLLIGGTLISGTCTPNAEIFTGVTIHGPSNDKLTYKNNFCVCEHIAANNNNILPRTVTLTDLAVTWQTRLDVTLQRYFRV